MMAKRLALIGVGLAIALGIISSCGSDDKAEDTGSPSSTDTDSSTNTSTTTTTEPTWAQVNTVLKANCSDSGCHGTTNPYSQYVDKESAYKTISTANRARIGTTKSDSMPPPDSDALTATEKATLLNYFD